MLMMIFVKHPPPKTNKQATNKLSNLCDVISITEINEEWNKHKGMNEVLTSAWQKIIENKIGDERPLVIAEQKSDCIKLESITEIECNQLSPPNSNITQLTCYTILT